MNLEHNTYIYLLVAALTIYAIRALPLTLIKKEITNTFIRSFLYYVPFVTLAVMAFPAIVTATSSPVSGIVAFVVAVVVAWVDGKPAEIRLVGDCMIGLDLTEGYHTVTFRYENRAFSWGWKISLFSSVVFAAISCRYDGPDWKRLLAKLHK